MSKKSNTALLKNVVEQWGYLPLECRWELYVLAMHDLKQRRWRKVACTGLPRVIGGRRRIDQIISTEM